MKEYYTNELKQIYKLKAGTPFYLSGIIYTARDRALNILYSKNIFPDFLENSIIYHAGPTETNKDGLFSCGPTTAKRMDKFLNFLFSKNLFSTIGKGERDIKIHKQFSKIYLLAIGGCGALYGKRIKKMEKIMFKQLGVEAIHKIEIEKFPLIIGINKNGKSIFK